MQLCLGISVLLHGSLLLLCSKILGALVLLAASLAYSSELGYRFDTLYWYLGLCLLALPKYTPCLNCNISSIPYIQGTSEKVRRILNEAGVKVAMRPVRTIGQILPSPKDPHNPEEKSCVVYQVPCSDCNFVYIGQTKRDLKSRLAEHKLAIKIQEPEKSALCEHYMQLDHLIDWNNSKILKTEAHYSKRLTSEAWFINSHPHVMN